MEKVIVYTQTLDAKLVDAALANLEIRLVAGRAELAEALVRESDVLCVVTQVVAIDAEFESFLASLKRSMPRLNVAVICESCREAVPEVFTHINDSLDADTLMQGYRWAWRRSLGYRSILTRLLGSRNQLIFFGPMNYGMRRTILAHR